MSSEAKLPFLYGVQYYRAPTPEPEFWENDLSNIKQMGCNTVKFWVQWRWSERREEEYYWDDLDQLMDLAHKNGLSVVLNLILDIMPAWVPLHHPDSLMVDGHGNTLECQAILSRQLGGYPGPCYSNLVMIEKRKRFFKAAIEHFKTHPALLTWDVWNEPEHHSKLRIATEDNLLCYCPSCAAGFRHWLRTKYRRIEKLNSVWGRCYFSFDEVEIPHDTKLISDFVDWREFHLDKLTADANWRLEMVKELDPERIAHLHVVPNTGSCFNTITCVDDFALAKKCEIFASTMMDDPVMCAQAISAAGGKYFYNAEWHLNYGGLAMHQRIITRQRFFREIIPQIGWGGRGFLYWQYRVERLGAEAPAWGLVHTDGTPRPVTHHAVEFIEKIAPYREALLQAKRQPARVAIWRSRRNEVFQFCRSGGLDQLYATLKSYADILYSLSVPFCFIDTEQLCSGLADDIDLLIMPQPYYLEQREADALDAFIHQGKVIISEGHLAGYASDEGRHSSVLPGCGLTHKWGIKEEDSTSSYQLETIISAEPKEANAEGDVKKALDTTGTKGGEYFTFECPDDSAGIGACDFAILAGVDMEVLGSLNEMPCVVRKTIGEGVLFYAGTLLGYGAQQDDTFLQKLLLQALEKAKIKPESPVYGLHIDRLYREDNAQPDFILFNNKTSEPHTVELPQDRQWREIFNGNEGHDIEIEPNTALMFYAADED
jgi:beta-galactosidase